MRAWIFILLIPLSSWSQPSTNKLDEKGKKQGKWVGFFEGDDAPVRYMGQFKDDRPIGTFTYFYRTGEVQSELKYEEEGIVRSVSFHKSGTVLAKGRYNGQVKDSTWLYYNKSSILIAREFYIEGKRYGLWKVYYDTGRLASETNWENDLENGVYKEYHTNGKVSREAKYVNGSIEGRGVFYHRNGRRRMEGFYRHDTKHGTWRTYNASAKLESEVNYVRGVPDGGLPVLKNFNSNQLRKKDRLDETDFLPGSR